MRDTPDYIAPWSVDPARPYVLGEIQTFTGKRVRPLELRVEDIDILDIAHALANQCRFTGHTREFYSVAQHSALVGIHTSSLAGLLHDASEAYLMDLASPLKNLPEFAAFKDIERRIQAVIEQRFELEPGALSCELVKHVDRKMLATEARDLMWREGFNLDRGIEAFDWKIEPYGPGQAKTVFLVAFAQFGGTL